MSSRTRGRGARGSATRSRGEKSAASKRSKLSNRELARDLLDISVSVKQAAAGLLGEVDESVPLGEKIFYDLAY